MKISIKDYSVTLFSGVAVSFYSFIILKLILVYYGDQALEFFSILKRYQSFLVPILLLGFGVTLPKYLAMKNISEKTIFQCLFMVVGAFLVALVSFFLFSGNYYLSVLLSLPALAAGFLYSIARGLNLFVEGSLVNIFFLVILPTIIFFMVDNVDNYIKIYFLLSICFFSVIFF
ncbi:MAG: hypothetical protein EOM83_14050 [Clostridia bacterium]|nr:hypothetical protein [Clostridia bacterium]